MTNNDDEAQPGDDGSSRPNQWEYPPTPPELDGVDRPTQTPPPPTHPPPPDIDRPTQAPPPPPDIDRPTVGPPPPPDIDRPTVGPPPQPPSRPPSPPTQAPPPYVAASPPAQPDAGRRIPLPAALAALIVLALGAAALIAVRRSGSDDVETALRCEGSAPSPVVGDPGSPAGVESFRRTLPGPAIAAPAVATGRLFVAYDGIVVDEGTVEANGDSLVQARSFETGDPVWTTVVEGTVWGPLMANNDAVYATTTAGQLVALGFDDGQQLLRCTGVAPLNELAANASSVFVGDDAGRLHAIDPTTGAVRWSAMIDGAIRGAPGTDVDQVYAASTDGTIAAFMAESGAEVWRNSIGEPIHSGVAATGDFVVVATISGGLVGLDAIDGRIRWSTELGAETTARPLAVGPNIVVGSADGIVRVIDIVSGEPRQSTDVGGRVDTTAVEAGNLVVVTSDAGTVTALSPDDGTIRWGPIRTPAVPSGPAAGDGIVAVVDLDGGLLVVE